MKKLKEFQNKQKCTLLGIGPMSKNCVDSTIEISNEYNIPLMLIASRRQIECEEFGRGYVNNWSTEDFTKYVKKKDLKEQIILCRDHGGPWQNEFEKERNLSIPETMKTAKKSFEKDIESGFEIIHIDSSTDTVSELTIDEILDRNFELYEHLWQFSKKLNKKIEFELSIGKEDGGIHTLEEIKYALDKILKFCSMKKIPTPLFLVIRTGNYVMEAKNVGNFKEIFSNRSTDSTYNNLKLIIELLNQNGIMLKEHNTDFLSDELLKFHVDLGIHACNVAPEFGIIETKTFLDLLKKFELDNEIDEFIELSYNSTKWEKWILPNSKLEKMDKAIISGHYIFSSPQFMNLKNKVKTKIPLDVDEFLKKEIKKCILRYIFSFNCVQK